MGERERLQSLYSASVKRLQTCVLQVCDRLDYPQSPIYDVYPDPLLIDRICASICEEAIQANGLSAEPELVRVLLIHELEERRAAQI